jgi:hypothetical protein
MKKSNLELAHGLAKELESLNRFIKTDFVPFPDDPVEARINIGNGSRTVKISREYAMELLLKEREDIEKKLAGLGVEV